MRSRALLLLLLALPELVAAHAGPPFPLLEDQPVGPYVVSVWTDPDIGTGLFYVMLEPQKDRALPTNTVVRVSVQPVSGRLQEAVYKAEPRPQASGEQHYAEVLFDEGGLWRVRIQIEGPEGGGVLESQVEPTPDGDIGSIGLLIRRRTATSDPSAC